jgi:hypothetical protein
MIYSPSELIGLDFNNSVWFVPQSSLHNCRSKGARNGCFGLATESSTPHPAKLREAKFPGRFLL